MSKNNESLLQTLKEYGETLEEFDNKVKKIEFKNTSGIQSNFFHRHPRKGEDQKPISPAQPPGRKSPPV